VKAFALVVLLALSGCSALKTGYEVRVPVAVACKAVEPDRPAWPTERLKPGVDPFVFVVHAQAEIDLREAYEGRLVAALRGCIDPVTTQP
jgi:starvation-inducible outer membrane lipoprotein